VDQAHAVPHLGGEVAQGGGEGGRVEVLAHASSISRAVAARSESHAAAYLRPGGWINPGPLTRGPLSWTTVRQSTSPVGWTFGASSFTVLYQSATWMV